MDEVFCRACLVPEGRFKHRRIFSENGKIAKDIYKLTSLMILDLTDIKCPAVLCQRCLVDLQSAISFRDLILTNNETLRTIFEERVKEVLTSLKSTNGSKSQVTNFQNSPLKEKSSNEPSQDQNESTPERSNLAIESSERKNSSQKRRDSATSNQSFAASSGSSPESTVNVNQQRRDSTWSVQEPTSKISGSIIPIKKLKGSQTADTLSDKSLSVKVFRLSTAPNQVLPVNVIKRHDAVKKNLEMSMGDSHKNEGFSAGNQQVPVTEGHPIENQLLHTSDNQQNEDFSIKKQQIPISKNIQTGFSANNRNLNNRQIESLTGNPQVAVKIHQLNEVSCKNVQESSISVRNNQMHKLPIRTNQWMNSKASSRQNSEALEFPSSSKEVSYPASETPFNSCHETQLSTHQYQKAITKVEPEFSINPQKSTETVNVHHQKESTDLTQFYTASMTSIKQEQIDLDCINSETILSDSQLLEELVETFQTDENVTSSNNDFFQAYESLPSFNYDSFGSIKIRQLSSIQPEKEPKSIVKIHVQKPTAKKRKFSELLNLEKTLSEADPNNLHCQLCPKVFSKRCYLTQHFQSVHMKKAKKFRCAKCGKRYATQMILDEHVAKHVADKPFNCLLCPKSFNHKADLKRHEISHSVDKPFNCTVCGRGFVRHDHLLKHIRMHERRNEKSTE